MIISYYYDSNSFRICCFVHFNCEVDREEHQTSVILETGTASGHKTYKITSILAYHNMKPSRVNNNKTKK